MQKHEVESSKNWRKRFNLSNSYYAFFLSFFWAFLYLLLCRFVDSPIKKIFPIEKEDFFLSSEVYFFSIAISSLLLSSISVFSLSGNYDLESPFLSKFLRSNIYSLIRIFWSGSFSYIVKNYSSGAKASLLLISYLFYFFSNYVTEIIVVQIEKNGIFEGFNLVYLVDNFYRFGYYLVLNLNPFVFSSNSILKIKSLKRIVFSFFLFLSFQVSALMYNLRWEVPIETNNFYSPFKEKNHYFLENSSEERPKFSLSFKLDPYNVISSRHYFDDLLRTFKHFSTDEKFSTFSTVRYFWKAITSSSLFLALGEDRFFSLLFYVIFYFSYLIYNYFVQTKHLSNDLKKRGVYFNGVPFDKKTRRFLFVRTTQIFLVKSLVMWLIVAVYKLLISNGFSQADYYNPDFLRIISFNSVLLYTLEQSKNYRNFMVFYE